MRFIILTCTFLLLLSCKTTVPNNTLPVKANTVDNWTFENLSDPITDVISYGAKLRLPKKNALKAHYGATLSIICEGPDTYLVADIWDSVYSEQLTYRIGTGAPKTISMKHLDVNNGFKSLIGKQIQTIDYVGIKEDILKADRIVLRTYLMHQDLIMQDYIFDISNIGDLLQDMITKCTSN